MFTFLKGTIVIPEAEAIQAAPVIEHTHNSVQIFADGYRFTIIIAITFLIIYHQLHRSQHFRYWLKSEQWKPTLYCLVRVCCCSFIACSNSCCCSSIRCSCCSISCHEPLHVLWWDHSRARGLGQWLRVALNPYFHRDGINSDHNADLILFSESSVLLIYFLLCIMVRTRYLRRLDRGIDARPTSLSAGRCSTSFFWISWFD